MKVKIEYKNEKEENEAMEKAKLEAKTRGIKNVTYASTKKGYIEYIK